MSLTPLLASWWRRRDDGWIAEVESVDGYRRPGKPRTEAARLFYQPMTGPAESQLVGEVALLRDFDRVREVRCRRCKTREVWRFDGPGERYVAHGCAAARVVLRDEERKAKARRKDRAKRRFLKMSAEPAPPTYFSPPHRQYRRRPPGRGVSTNAGVKGITVAGPREVAGRVLQGPGAVISGEVYATSEDDVLAGEEVAILRDGKLGRHRTPRRTEGWFQNATWMTATKRGEVGRIRIREPFLFGATRF